MKYPKTYITRPVEVDCRKYRTQRVLESTAELVDMRVRRAVIWEMIKLTGMAPSTLHLPDLLDEYENLGGGN